MTQQSIDLATVKVVNMELLISALQGIKDALNEIADRVVQALSTTSD